MKRLFFYAILVSYLFYLMLKFLFEGDTMMFLIATIACGVWCISCTIHKEKP